MAELTVNKRDIGSIFRDMQGKKFLIPDFQRPYKWDIEKCETLWKDIEEFSQTSDSAEDNYFLGTIVSYVENSDLAIIDGQQRIISILLLLRAFYHKLEKMKEDPDVLGLKNQIAPCIWDINSISQTVEDKNKVHIESLSATDDDKEIFKNILKTGEANPESKDYYSQNYIFFLEKCKSYAEEQPLQWKNFCVTILKKCIILPIECHNQERALTIFSTLNDRGLPLSDSDIFKAKIYQNLPNEDRKEFTDAWKNLTSICDSSSINIDDIFKYYTHIIRARNDDKSKEVGLRKFYSVENYSRLKINNLMDELQDLSSFWQNINGNNTLELSDEVLRYLHILKFYPNEYWKYPLGVFFINNKDSKNFNIELAKILKKLAAYLLVKFIYFPTVNAIKDDIFAACISIHKENTIKFKYQIPSNIQDKISDFSVSKLTRSLLILNEYLQPNSLFNKDFEVEHIFPRKWQTDNYNGWSRKDADKYLECFGNKIPLEKKLNISAGNNYFNQKKASYSKSKFLSARHLSLYAKLDWTKEDILSRDAQFKTNLIQFFKNELE